VSRSFAPMSGSPGSFSTRPREDEPAHEGRSWRDRRVGASRLLSRARPSHIMAQGVLSSAPCGAVWRRAAHDDFIDHRPPRALERRGDQGGPGRDHGEELRRARRPPRSAAIEAMVSGIVESLWPGPARHDLAALDRSSSPSAPPQRARPADGEGIKTRRRALAAFRPSRSLKKAIR